MRVFSLDDVVSFFVRWRFVWHVLYICCLCKEGANARAFLTSQPHRHFHYHRHHHHHRSRRNVCGTCMHTCACVFTWGNSLSFQHCSSVERYILYSVLCDNDQPHSDVESGLWLLVAESASASRTLHLPPLPPSVSAESSRQAQCRYERYAT